MVNTETLEEYEGQASLNQDYVPKLSHWIQKKKFKCTPSAQQDALKLQVDLFGFDLKKKEKTDIQKVNEEVAKLQEDKLMIDKEMKLFNFYFFNYWREQTKEYVRQMPTPIISADQLYFFMEGSGHVEQPVNAVEGN